MDDIDNSDELMPQIIEKTQELITSEEEEEVEQESELKPDKKLKDNEEIIVYDGVEYIHKIDEDGEGEILLKESREPVGTYDGEDITWSTIEDYENHLTRKKKSGKEIDTESDDTEGDDNEGDGTKGDSTEGDDEKDDEAVGGRIDYASTLKDAYSKLDKILGKDGVENLGIEAKKVMDKGALVSDDIIVGLVVERLKKPDCSNGVLFDGFPRTIPQAQALDDANIGIDLIIEIQLDDENIIERMSGRRVHISSGRNYHVKFNPPKKNIVVTNDKQIVHVMIVPYL